MELQKTQLSLYCHEGGGLGNRTRFWTEDSENSISSLIEIRSDFNKRLLLVDEIFVNYRFSKTAHFGPLGTKNTLKNNLRFVNEDIGWKYAKKCSELSYTVSNLY